MQHSSFLFSILYKCGCVIIIYHKISTIIYSDYLHVSEIIYGGLKFEIQIKESSTHYNNNQFRE